MMKLLLLVGLSLTVSAFPFDSDSSSSEEEADEFGLKWFDRSELTDNMKEYLVDPSAECSAEVQDCMVAAHQQAKQCVTMWHTDPEEGEALAECEGTNEGVKAADKEWQKASGKYHSLLGKCLAGQEVPASDDDDDEFFFFRRKRHTHHAGHQEAADEETYADYKECWAAMQDHKQHCNEKMKGCKRMAICAPLDESQAVTDEEKAWYQVMKKAAMDKAAKVGEHKKLLHQCLGHEEAHWQRVDDDE